MEAVAVGEVEAAAAELAVAVTVVAGREAAALVATKAAGVTVVAARVEAAVATGVVVEEMVRVAAKAAGGWVAGEKDEVVWAATRAGAELAVVAMAVAAVAAREDSEA